MDGGSTGNHPVNDFVESGDLDCVRIFIAHGASMKSPDSWWGLPMHHLAGFTDVSKDYHEHRSRACSPRVPSSTLANRSGETPLWLAAQRSRPEMVSFLLEKGANPNAKTLTQPFHPPLGDSLRAEDVPDRRRGQTVSSKREPTPTSGSPGRVGAGRERGLHRAPAGREDGYLAHRRAA